MKEEVVAARTSPWWSSSRFTRASWGAIFAGTFVTIILQVMFTLLGAAVGFSSIGSQQPASAQSLTTGSYPFWSVEHIYTQGDGSDQALAWMQFLSSQQEANTLLASGVVPLGMLSSGVLLSHLPGPEF